jgi:cellulose synthase/poly-beta-1,6-N-acetylglucosamine synthase-like glycosyltransferase
MMQDEIGVVVIGRNEGERLMGCLQSIGPTKFDVVYVDSGSTDGSDDLVEKLGVLVVRLDLLYPVTAARARNEGFAALLARMPGKRFVQFIDGDCELDSGWLCPAFDFIDTRNDVAVVCGRRREKEPGASIYNQLCDIEWDTPVGEAVACGGDSLIRVEAFQSVGGFRSQLIAGEEPEMCLRMREVGWKIWRIDANMTRHDAAIKRFSQWWLRSVRSGYGMMQVSHLHRRSTFRLWSRAVWSAAFWSGFLPVIIVLAIPFTPLAFLGLLIYPLQICRIALNRGIRMPHTWAYALFMVIGQFPVLQGIIKFWWRSLLGSAGSLIEYK